MRLQIEHRTSFAYDVPISEAYTELRLRPLETSGQHCVSFRIATDPPGVRARPYVDHRGNVIQHFDVLEPHDRLTVTATSDVLTSPTYLDADRPPTQLEAYDYLAPTAYVTISAPVAAFAANADPGGAKADRAATISAVIFREFAYEVGVTDVHTRADEVLTLGRGVCQDFAHLLLAACRSRGIVSRYVSGYLYDPSLVGDTAASHAWVDVYDEQRGWVSLDPTHNCEQTDAYVRVAIGRDYAEVPPTRGVYKGTAAESLEVRVGIDTT